MGRGDLETFVCLSTLSGHTSRVLSVAWSPDGQKNASSNSDHRTKTLDVGDTFSVPYFNEKFQFID